MSGPTSGRTGAFISYSQKDKKYLDRLQIHLAPFVRRDRLEIWDDTRIEPGSPWEDEIKQAIASAKVAILLVSANFLASKFITENELPPLLNAAVDEGVRLLFVIVSPSAYEFMGLDRYEAMNSPSQPLSAMGWTNRERVWQKVAVRTHDLLTRP